MKSAFDFDRSHAAFISLHWPPCQAAQLGLRQFFLALHDYQGPLIVEAASENSIHNKNRDGEQYEE